MRNFLRPLPVILRALVQGMFESFLKARISKEGTMMSKHRILWAVSLLVSMLFSLPNLSLSAQERRTALVKRWKKPKKFQRMMICSGFSPHAAQRVWIKMNKSQSVTRKEVRFVMNLKWFRKQGVTFLDDLARTPLGLPLFSC